MKIKQKFKGHVKSPNIPSQCKVKDIVFTFGSKSMVFAHICWYLKILMTIHQTGHQNCYSGRENFDWGRPIEIQVVGILIGGVRFWLEASECWLGAPNFEWRRRGVDWGCRHIVVISGVQQNLVVSQTILMGCCQQDHFRTYHLYHWQSFGPGVFTSRMIKDQAKLSYSSNNNIT